VFSIWKEELGPAVLTVPVADAEPPVAEPDPPVAPAALPLIPVTPVAEIAAPVAVPAAVRADVAGNGEYVLLGLAPAAYGQSRIFRVCTCIELLTSCTVVRTVLNNRIELSLSCASRTGLDTAVANAEAEVLHATQTGGIG
jgi:hypothetical protein